MNWILNKLGSKWMGKKLEISVAKTKCPDQLWQFFHLPKFKFLSHEESHSAEFCKNEFGKG